MFSNIIGQEEAVASLSRDLAGHELPGSILFEGPRDSAKLTTALETARVLSCERRPRGPVDGFDRVSYVPWDCDCPSCRRHRLLAHPDLLILGPKSFRPEIAAASEAFLAEDCLQTRYLLLRACRKLMKRFDAELYDHEETRLSKALPSVRALEELCDLVDPSRGKDADADPAKTAREALALAEKLEALVPATTPVFMVRAVEKWARLAPNGERKCVVIENADRMLDSSRNALLKILEEPPESTAFILTTSRKGAMIATVLSRVRLYRFSRRTPALERDIATRVFKAALPEEGGLERFFEARGSERGAAVAPAARKFADALCAEADSRRQADSRRPSGGAFGSSCRCDDGPEAALAEAKALTASFGASDDAYEYSFVAFLSSVIDRFRALARDPAATDDELDTLAAWSSAVEKARTSYESWNIPPQAAADLLLAELRSRA